MKCGRVEWNCKCGERVLKEEEKKEKKKKETIVDEMEEVSQGSGEGSGGVVRGSGKWEPVKGTSQDIAEPEPVKEPARDSAVFGVDGFGCAERGSAAVVASCSACC